MARGKQRHRRHHPAVARAKKPRAFIPAAFALLFLVVIGYALTLPMALLWLSRLATGPVEADGAAAGLAALAELERLETMDHYQPYHAAKADLLRRAGRHTAAVAAYRRAIELTENAVERRFLEGRLREVSSD